MAARRRGEIPVCRAAGPGEGARGADDGLACVGPSSTRRRARPRRRGVEPRARSRAGGAAARRTEGVVCLDARRRRSAAQRLRGLRRSGAALDPHAHLSRALGAGGQRGHEPGAAGDRKRRRRRRRRRPGARRAQRPGRARGRQRALAEAIRRLARRRARCASAWAQPARRTCARYSHDAWATGFSRALATVGVSRERW